MHVLPKTMENFFYCAIMNTKMEKVDENLLKSFVLGKPVLKLSERNANMYILKSYIFLKDQHIWFFQNESEPSWAQFFSYPGDVYFTIIQR